MKIETSKLVCDRCGVEVKEQHSRFAHFFTSTRHFMHITEQSEEPVTYSSEGDIEKINDEVLVETVELHTTFEKNTKTYDLCKKCRKDFIRFMEGKDGYKVCK